MQRTTFSRFAVVFALSALAVAGPLAGHAVASHGDYFHVTWQQRAARTVDFTVASAFHRSSYDADDCVPGPCRGPNGVPAVGDVVTEDVAGTVLYFGDGEETDELEYLVTALNEAEDQIVVVALDPDRPEGNTDDTLIGHTYPADEPGPWTAEIDDCCTAATLLNNAANDYRNGTLVNLAADQQSARSTVAPIVRVGVRGVQRWRVPATDAGGQRLRWRLATAEEACAEECDAPQPPGLSIAADTGQVTWDTTGVAEGLWFTAVVIESLNAAGGIVSTTQVNYLIRVGPVAPAGACSLRLSTRRVTAGVSTTIVVRAFRGRTPVAGVRVVLTGTGGIRRQSARTNAQGIARFTVRATSANARIRVRAEGGCGARTIAAARSSNCSGLRFRPGTLEAGRPTAVRVTVRLAGKPVVGMRVVLDGAGVRASARTDRRGLARVLVVARRPGTVRVRVPQALTCSRRLGVAAAVSGEQLTGKS